MSARGASDMVWYCLSCSQVVAAAAPFGPALTGLDGLAMRKTVGVVGGFSIREARKVCVR